MIRNLLPNAVCPSKCVCFYARNGVPCEEALRSAAVAGREKEGELATIRLWNREETSLRHVTMVNIHGQKENRL